MPPVCLNGKTIYKVEVGPKAGGKPCMFCASCGTDNAEDQKLCIRCGSLLGPICPWCGSCNRAGEAFCHGCRARLPELPAAGYDAESPEPESFVAGRYQVIGRLRASGAKRVYLADDNRLGRKVSVAAISTFGLGDQAREQIMQVARSAARVAGHPHITGVYEAGEENGLVYVLSEHLAAGSLADLLSISKNHRLPIAEVLRIGTQICDALEYAHSLGVVHGDLTPASVMIAPEGSVKVGDFGLGFPLTINLSRMAGEGVPADTAAYVAPEQMLGGPPEPRGDLYSLGVILYEMMAGSLPSAWGDSDAPIAERLRSKPLRFERGDAPGALLSLVRRMLHKRPEKRPPNAASVGAAMRSMAAGLRPGSAVTESAPPPIGGVSLELSGAAASIGADAWAALNVVSYVAPLSSAIAAVAILAVLSVGSMRVAYKWFGQFDSVTARRVQWPQLTGVGADQPHAQQLASADHEPVGDDRAPSNLAPASSAAAASQTAPQPENRDRIGTADSGQTGKPYPELFDLARDGDPAAETALGNIYLRGQDASRSYAQALRWFEKGAAAGNPQAQVGLGYMYATGKGVAQDYKLAAKWFLMAGSKGDPGAEYNLAVMYDQGQGLSVNRTEALKWLRRAAAQDDARAQYELGRKYMEGQERRPGLFPRAAMAAESRRAGQRSGRECAGLSLREIQPWDPQLFAGREMVSQGRRAG